ncbi:sensor histidine kinase [Nonomuraea africana]|uniref:Signal transduction histidine kinase n=1 Tax=Nonomuraea africana TaxID=46171 RepID=A0ABR9KID1_9ACTN|nr:ATP-binding protein [Nonomuraea africana]MBE1561715.1 signal transduction histidine kinase [Nonomuraea africana]
MRGGRSLAEALESHLAEWSQRTGIAVEVWALPRGDVPATIARSVMAVVEEALLNVERHSGAGTVSFAVTVGAGGLRLTVSDDGEGFSVPRERGGIARMRARMAEVGGSLSVNSVQGEGTTVSAVVPRRKR